MHTDEAVNAYIVGQLLGGETFTYDPQDRHGPALAAFALPLASMQGARSFSDLSESVLRLTSVVAGTITILLFGAAAEMFGLGPSLLAALLFAVAPLPVYYDRYFIHESLFCAATFGLILSGWHAWKSRSATQAALAGACAALMFASKETAILHLFALAAAAFVFRVWNLRGESFARSLRPGPLLAASGTFLVLLVILFTWFGRNAKGLHASVTGGSRMCSRERLVKVIKSPSGITASFSPAGGPVDCCSPLPASGFSSASENAILHPMLCCRITPSSSPQFTV